MKKRDLERALEAVPDFPRPDPALEQYKTPAPIAADLLWAAHADGVIEGHRVLDLGCGTGTLALGAHLLGANVFGVDADADAIALAREAVPDGSFEVASLDSWQPPQVDTVIMNPPFGAQKKGADRIFLTKAAEATKPHGTVWFLAQAKTERFLDSFARGLGGTLERVGQWDYPIPARFWFHDEEVRTIRVGGYRMAYSSLSES